MMGEQPAPTFAGEPVIAALIADLQQRERQGIATYGGPLTAHNGRDALADARDEALDLAVYLHQAVLERATLHAGLERYGRHEDDCTWRHGPGRCTCGLWAALGVSAPPADYRQARGVLGAQPGDPLPEEGHGYG